MFTLGSPALPVPHGISLVAENVRFDDPAIGLLIYQPQDDAEKGWKRATIPLIWRFAEQVGQSLRRRSTLWAVPELLQLDAFRSVEGLLPGPWKQVN